LLSLIDKFEFMFCLKSILRYTFIISTYILFTLSFKANATSPCGSESGFPVPPLLSYYVDSLFDPSQFIVTDYTFVPTNYEDKGFIVTEGKGYDAPIIGFTEDGSWGFENAIPGLHYCFFATSYKQYEIDTITNKPSVQALNNCIAPNMDFHDFVDCIDTNFIYNINGLHTFLDTFIIDIGGCIIYNPPCVPPLEPCDDNNPDTQNSMYSYDCTCISFPEQHNCTSVSAGEPEFPLDAYCLHNQPEDLIVDNFTSLPTGGDKYGYFVTIGNYLLGFSDTGYWDFSESPPDEYCFHPIVYNNADLEVMSTYLDVFYNYDQFFNPDSTSIYTTSYLDWMEIFYCKGQREGLGDSLRFIDFKHFIIRTFNDLSENQRYNFDNFCVRFGQRHCIDICDATDFEGNGIAVNFNDLYSTVNLEEENTAYEASAINWTGQTLDNLTELPILDSTLTFLPDNFEDPILYPNPNKGKFKIVADKPLKVIALYDFAGRKVDFVNANNQIKVLTDVIGLYTIQYEINAKTYTKSFVIN